MIGLSTIGYSGHDRDSFLALLVSHDIQRVIDVRAMPWSRKPAFSKKALAASLAQAGLDYVHIVELGCPRAIRDQYRADHDWERYRADFLAHLAGQQAALAKVCELAGAAPSALLCMEADYRHCHRALVAQAVSGLCGASIRHIVAPPARPEGPAAAGA